MAFYRCGTGGGAPTITYESLTSKSGTESSDTYTYSWTVQSGRTLWKDMFPIVTSCTFWSYNGDAGASSGTFSWSYTDPKLKLTIYRHSKIGGRVYYID